MLQPYTLSAYCSRYAPLWTCKMPTWCPPEDIMVCFAHPFFRLAHNADTFDEQDFMSYAELFPQRPWGEMLPLAVGLSLIDNEAKARKNLKLPIFRRHKGIIALQLDPEDGVVKQTGNHLSHYTWWRTQSFHINKSKMLAV